MSHCHHYVFATLNIKSKAALKWSCCSLCFPTSLPFPLMTCDFKKHRDFEGQKIHEYLSLCYLWQGTHPKPMHSKLMFSKCILDFICRLHVLFSLNALLPLPCNTETYDLALYNLSATRNYLKNMFPDITINTIHGVRQAFQCFIFFLLFYSRWSCYVFVCCLLFCFSSVPRVVLSCRPLQDKVEKDLTTGYVYQRLQYKIRLNNPKNVSLLCHVSNQMSDCDVQAVERFEMLFILKDVFWFLLWN